MLSLAQYMFLSCYGYANPLTDAFNHAHTHTQLGGIPFFGKLGGVKDSSAFKKGKDLYEDMRVKYETSDNPAVHKVQAHAHAVNIHALCGHRQVQK